MKRYSLPFGKKTVDLGIPKKNILDLLEPKAVIPDKDEISIMQDALNHPIASPPLSEIVSGKSNVVVITNDATRPTASLKMLPLVLEELKIAGIHRSNITIVFALGIHRKHTLEEQKKLVGEAIFHTYQCIDHEYTHFVDMGETRNGIPVQIFDMVADADVKICMGNIDPHYFVGYTGGAKAIMPGVSSKASITSTHKMMLLPGSIAGNLEGNPARQAIEEVGEKVGIDFILNVVVNPHKQIIGAVAGHSLFAHRSGCMIADECFKVPIKEKADIVIVSAGGYPKDVNVYQAQKALDNAKYAVEKGGTIILLAECAEGLGNDIFQQWVWEATSPRGFVERLQEEFILGGHKAAAIGMLLQDINVIMVTSLSPEYVKRLFFEPARSLDEALALALQYHGNNASISIMPSGGITLPYLG